MFKKTLPPAQQAAQDFIYSIVTQYPHTEDLETIRFKEQHKFLVLEPYVQYSIQSFLDTLHSQLPPESGKILGNAYLEKVQKHKNIIVTDEKFGNFLYELFCGAYSRIQKEQESAPKAETESKQSLR